MLKNSISAYKSIVYFVASVEDSTLPPLLGGWYHLVFTVPSTIAYFSHPVQQKYHYTQLIACLYDENILNAGKINSTEYHTL